MVYLENCEGAFTAYSWQDLSSSLAEKVADMAEKLAQPFTQTQTLSFHSLVTIEFFRFDVVYLEKVYA